MALILLLLILAALAILIRRDIRRPVLPTAPTEDGMLIRHVRPGGTIRYEVTDKLLARCARAARRENG